MPVKVEDAEMADQCLLRRNPADLAAIDLDGAWRWGALERRICSLSDALAAAGAQGKTVVLRASHGAGSYAALIAVLGMARRVVFIDPEMQIEPLQLVMTALNIGCVVNLGDEAPMKSLRDWLPQARFIMVAEGACDPDDPQFLGQGERIEYPLLCDDYVILTSGTTGAPKAIVQTMAALRQHIANYAGYVQIRPGEKLLQLASTAWDAGLMDVFSALFHGGVLCTINPRASSMEIVADFIARHEIDVLHMTVPYFRHFHRAGLGTYRQPKRIVIGGEKIYDGDLDLFNGCFPVGSRLFNAYGPTECTTAMYAMHDHGAERKAGLWPLAHPVPGVITELRDKDGNRISTSGVEGEVTLISDLVASLLDLTHGGFTPLGEALRGTARAYATGDLARYDEQMRLVIIGRKDSVIKVNGLKVSLAEVEAGLLSLDMVADCCVFTLVGEDGDEVVAAVVASGDGITEARVQKALADCLDRHKRPRLILLMDRLPLTRNNKFDREALARMARDKRQAAEIDSPQHAPILAAMGKALKGASLDINHSFFENGGNSLLALSVVAALKRQGIKLALEEIISDKPISGLLNGQGQQADLAVPAMRIAAAGLDAALPNRNFLESRGIPDLDGWCQTCVIDYSGPVSDADRIGSLVKALLERHVPDARQIVIDALTSGMTVSQAVAECEGAISFRNNRVVVAALVAEGNQLSVVVSCHQFQVDRISWIILLSELSEADTAEVVQAWPKPDMDYADWVRAYGQFLANERASEVWDRLPWGECPQPIVRNLAFPARNAFKTLHLDIGSPSEMLARDPLMEIADWLLAAVLLAFDKVFPAACQTIDVLGHGRGLTAGGLSTDGIFGWFTVICPFLVKVRGLDVAAAARAVRHYRHDVEQIAHTFGNEHYRSGERSGASAERQCFASFNYLGDIAISSTDRFSINPLSLTTLHGRPSHHLEVTGYQHDGRLLLKVDYNATALGEALVSDIGRHIATALRDCGVITLAGEAA
ncbi:AMP-binding protein [Agrobacterium vitis]|uniref:AMP-binding protein n=1 Tax=Agrobacterium vitis TaxID=373 RepID=A0A6L6VIR6_AGRVI|nr:AMP-binding protein [Agrobacterium vitis]MUZ74099.1 AMP-binding protein [Agrobacterium vitis]